MTSNALGYHSKEDKAQYISQFYLTMIQVIFPVKTTIHYLVRSYELRLQSAFHQ